MTKSEIKAHWEYLKGVLEHEIPEGTMLTKEQHITAVAYHYMTALEHGAKHERSRDGS